MLKALKFNFKIIWIFCLDHHLVNSVDYQFALNVSLQHPASVNLESLHQRIAHALAELYQYKARYERVCSFFFQDRHCQERCHHPNQYHL
jgi:hypothetical protein